MLNAFFKDAAPVVIDKTNAAVVILDPLCVSLYFSFDLCSLGLNIRMIYATQKPNLYKNLPEVGDVMTICEADHSSECIVLGSSLRCFVEACDVEFFWDRNQSSKNIPYTW